MDDSHVIFKAGTVERKYGGVTVAVHASRDVTVGDWMPSAQRFFAQAERDRRARS